MHGLILLDGPDCAGKTTLCETIMSVAEKRGHKAVRHHLGKKVKGTAWQEDSSTLLSYIQEMVNDNVIVIADRHFLSEAVYGRAYRDGSEYPYAMRYIDMLFNRVAGLKVICCPPVEKVVSKHKEMMELRHEEYKDGMDKVAEEFQRLICGDVFPNSYPGVDYLHQLQITGGVETKALWYHYDYTKHDVYQFAGKLIDELQQEQDLQHFVKGPYNGTAGKFSTLFVGDKISVDNPLGIPFFANKGSSLFLAKAFHQLMLPAEKLCLVNVNDPDGVQTARQLASICGRVIVMGRDAERTMKLNKIDYDAYIRHPQHARRFNHNDDTYVNEIKAALEN